MGEVSAMSRSMRSFETLVSLHMPALPLDRSMTSSRRIRRLSRLVSVCLALGVLAPTVALARLAWHDHYYINGFDYGAGWHWEPDAPAYPSGGSPAGGVYAGGGYDNRSGGWRTPWGSWGTAGDGGGGGGGGGGSSGTPRETPRDRAHRKRVQAQRAHYATAIPARCKVPAGSTAPTAAPFPAGTAFHFAMEERLDLTVEGVLRSALQQAEGPMNRYSGTPTTSPHGGSPPTLKEQLGGGENPKYSFHVHPSQDDAIAAKRRDGGVVVTVGAAVGSAGDPLVRVSTSPTGTVHVIVDTRWKGFEHAKRDPLYFSRFSDEMSKILAEAGVGQVAFGISKLNATTPLGLPSPINMNMAPPVLSACDAKIGMSALKP